MPADSAPRLTLPVDPLSEEPIRYPVVGPNGKLYDWHHLRNWWEDHDTTPESDDPLNKKIAIFHRPLIHYLKSHPPANTANTALAALGARENSSVPILKRLNNAIDTFFIRLLERPAFMWFLGRRPTDQQTKLWLRLLEFTLLFFLIAGAYFFLAILGYSALGPALFSLTGMPLLLVGFIALTFKSLLGLYLVNVLFAHKTLLDRFAQNAPLKIRSWLKIPVKSVSISTNYQTSLRENASNQLPVNSPKAFICPITHRMMRFPVMLASGYVCEFDAAVSLLKEENPQCPVTKKPLSKAILFADFALQGLIENHLSENPTHKIYQNVTVDDPNATLAFNSLSQNYYATLSLSATNKATEDKTLEGPKYTGSNWRCCEAVMFIILSFSLLGPIMVGLIFGIVDLPLACCMVLSWILALQACWADKTLCHRIALKAQRGMHHLQLNKHPFVRRTTFKTNKSSAPLPPTGTRRRNSRVQSAPTPRPVTRGSMGASSRQSSPT